MAKNIYGGGSQTNANGLKFEQETDLKSALLEIDGYEVKDHKLYYHKEFLGILAQKHKLYTEILIPNDIDYKKYISKQLLPDESLYIPENKKIFILEKKFQNVGGSVDEKLQTCDFKKKQYAKLFAPLNIYVEYIYILNNWFKKEQYKDVLEYIKASNCYYFFNEIPLDFLGIPHK